jgi:hypothetical protein
MPTLSSNDYLAFYPDYTAVIATSRQAALLFSYMETYLSEKGGG